MFRKTGNNKTNKYFRFVSEIIFFVVTSVRL